MDQYERLKVLGHGSYGTALLVRERRSGRRGQYRVIKEIDLTRMPASEQAEAQVEANVLRSLSHINIVAYIDTFVEEVKLHIVMEFADGGDLSKVIKKNQAENRNFNQDEVLSIFMQCCLALQHIHCKHVLHRDLKSQNIFMTKGGVVKLGDFGIAKVLDHTGAEAMTMIGTPNYLSPEVVDNKPYGTKADIWSLGVVLYELMVLEPPFQGNCLAALVVKIVTAEPKAIPTELYSEGLRVVVTWCLQKMPEKRPTADELLGLPVLRHGIGLLPPVVAEASSAPQKSAASNSRHGEAKRAQPKQEAPAQARNVRRRPSSGSKPRTSLPASTPRRGGRDVATPNSIATGVESMTDCFTGGDAVDQFLLNREIATKAKQRAEGSSLGHRSGYENAGRLNIFGDAGSSSASGHQWPRPRSSRQESPSPAAMASECRRNRELARQTRARVEGEGHAPYATPERGNGDDSTPTSAANSARERARERRESEEGQHRQALLQAAAQARLDRKFVQQKMQELDRANSSGTCSVALVDGAENSLDAVFSVKQYKEEPTRRAPPAAQREARASRAQASPGFFSDSPAADGSLRADISDGGGAAASAVAAVASAAAAAAEASFRHCCVGRFNAVAEDGHGSNHAQPSPNANVAAGPQLLRRDSKRGKSSIGLVGGMVASVNSRPVTADVKEQASEELYGITKAELLGPMSHLSLEDRLVDELTRCGASPPSWRPGLTTADLVEWTGVRAQSPAVDDVIDDDVDMDAMSDSWHAAKTVTDQAAVTLEYSLTMPLSSPQAAL